MESCLDPAEVLPAGSGRSHVWLPLLQRPAPQAAPYILGARLGTRAGLVLRVTEVEAYDGPGLDEASHAHRGPTSRNAAMFGEPGCVYVYLSYGIHHCVNIVAHEPGSAGGILLRAATVEDGLAVARESRPNDPPHRLASGPGRLGRLIGAELSDSGTSALGGGLLWFLSPPPDTPLAAANGPRVGISRGTTAGWRWWLPGERSVSRR